MKTSFTELVGIDHPIICGAMYPCSNPELVAAASEAGAIGIVQPVSLTYVYKYDFVEGLRHIRQLTKKPIGLNLLIEKSSKTYYERNLKWLDQALDEGVRFFITALGDPAEVVRRAKARGAVVFHDVTARKWADKAAKAGVDGLICVNRNAGGHAGGEDPQDLLRDLQSLGLPLICAGGIGSRESFERALRAGYQGVQMGTRFIATKECAAHQDYKQAILKARAEDVVLTAKLTGVPVAVIKTPYIEKLGVETSFLTNFFLRHPRTKHWLRLYFSLKSTFQLRKSMEKGNAYKEFFAAGKSVAEISEILTVKQIIEGLTEPVPSRSAQS